MMDMKTMPVSEDFPPAMLLARLSDVVMNNNVLYRLIRPTEQGTEVVSVDRLVNVVPFRRVYCFDHKDELEQFSKELLRRPLVLQPVVHFGRGFGPRGYTCGMCYKDDKWIMMINQTHPKILSRLQIGLDAAKTAIARGQSCEIRFEFSSVVQKIYKHNLIKSEDESAEEMMDVFKSYFRYAEWEYGDLIIRYHGYAALLGRRIGIKEVSTLKLTFNFEDLITPEIGWKSLGADYYPKPHLAPVDEDEIRENLPEWTVNGVSPLESIGEQAPSANYSYAQAGRLYESFRKKKRQQRAEVGDKAEGRAPPAAVRPTVNDGIELKVSAYPDEESQWQPEYDDEYDRDPHQGYAGAAYPYKAGYEGEIGFQNQPHQWRGQHGEEAEYTKGQGARPKTGSAYSEDRHLYPEVRVTNSGKMQSPHGDSPYSGALPRRSPGPYAGSPPATSPGHFRSDDQGPDSQVHASHTQNPAPSPYSNTNPGRGPGTFPTAPPRAKQRQGGYGNSPPAASPGQFPNSSRTPGQDPYARPSPMQEDNEYTPLRNQFTRLQMQGSDRSSHSSGVADSGISSDSDGHIRDGSYEKPRPASMQQYSPVNKYAVDNHGFDHDDETDITEAMRKHKELIAKMISGAPSDADSGFHDNRQQRPAVQISSRDTSGYLPSHHSKGDLPPSHSPNGYFDYGNKPYDHDRNLQSNRQEVEESFI